jgi:valyl-tRNA synthetase
VRNVRSELGVHPRDRVVVDAPANVPDEMRTLLALLAQATVERSAAAGATVDEALAAVGVRAPRELLAERYRKEALQLRSEIERGERKLSNEAFVAKAATNVVAKEREKLENYRSELARVEAALAQLKEPA